jgi:hypothetical protein
MDFIEPGSREVFGMHFIMVVVEIVIQEQQKNMVSYLFLRRLLRIVVRRMHAQST